MLKAYMTQENSYIHFEDTEDMMEHVHEQIEEAVYFYCLCTKIMMHGADPSLLKGLLIHLVSDQFDEINKKLIPYIETKGNETRFYGLIQRDF